MASVNKVIIVGNLGRDPEIRYNNDGGAICNVSIATTSNWKDKNSGERREETEWHRVVFYGRLAEIAGEYLKKGRSIYLEGRLKTNKWTDDKGVERYTTQVVADQMQMLGAARGDEAQAAPEHEAAPSAEPAKPAGKRNRSAAKASKPAGQASTLADLSDDIPF